MTQRKTTFRSLQGFKEWACDNDIRGGVATGNAHSSGPDTQYFVENSAGEILTVNFDKVTGRITDAMLHREHVTHMLGSNTLANVARGNASR